MVMTNSRSYSRTLYIKVQNTNTISNVYYELSVKKPGTTQTVWIPVIISAVLAGVFTIISFVVVVVTIIKNRRREYQQV